MRWELQHSGFDFAASRVKLLWGFGWEEEGRIVGDARMAGMIIHMRAAALIDETQKKALRKGRVNQRRMSVEGDAHCRRSFP